MRRRSFQAEADLRWRLGGIMLERLDRLEEIDRCAPGTEFTTDLTVGTVRYAMTVRVTAREGNA